jgi:hypothetical protein
MYMYTNREIAFYNVCTTEHGTIKLPDAFFSRDGST